MGSNSEETTMQDYRNDDRQRRWWDEKVLLGLSRNDISFIVIGIVITVLFYRFPINWDFVFGLRP